MNTDHLTTLIPFERYRAILSSLEVERSGWMENFWLRFAAQAAVLCPDPPDQVAHRIRHIAAALLHQTTWYHSLASPARFVIAAMLIQQHLPVHEFLAAHGRASALFANVGLRHSGFYETSAVFILRMTAGHQAFTILEAERLKAIYDQMKRCHWWLTGPHDLPACAALAQCRGSAATVIAQAERAYQQLHGSGLLTGTHLQTAANLLPLVGVGIDEAIFRYRRLKNDLEERIGPIPEESYDALVVLTMLDHPTRRIVDQMVFVLGELNLMQPGHCGPTNNLIAADLVFLDLVRLCSRPDPIRELRVEQEILTGLRMFHIISAVLVSHVTSDRIERSNAYAGLLWP